MAEDLGKLVIEVEANTENLKKNLNQVSKDITNFSENSKTNFINFKNVAETALGFSFASMLLSAGDSVRKFATDTVINTIKTNEALDGLKLQIGDTAKNLVLEMRKASDGLVNDFDLILNANKALALGLRKEDIPGLLEVATARSKLLGISATKAFEDITTGVARNSKQILDNLGIIVDLDKAYYEYAQSVGKTVESLSEQDKKQALVNSTIKESAGLTEAMRLATDNLTTDVQQLTVDINNLGTSFLNGVLHLDKYKEGMEGLSTAWNILTENVGDKTLNVNAQDALSVIGTEAIENSKKLDILNSTFNNTKKIFSDFKALFQAPYQGQADIEKQLAEIDLQSSVLEKRKLELNTFRNENGIEGEDSMLTFYDEQISKLETQRKLIEADRDVRLNRINLLEKEGTLELEKLKPQEKSLNLLKEQSRTYLETIKDLPNQIKLHDDLNISYNKEANKLKDMTTELSSQEYILRKKLLLMQSIDLLFNGIAFTGVSKELKKPAGQLFDTIESLAKINDFVQKPKIDNNQLYSPMPNPNNINNNSNSNINFNFENFYSSDPTKTADDLQTQFNSMFK